MADEVVRLADARLRGRTGAAATLPPELLAEGVRRLGRLSFLIAICMAVTVVTLIVMSRNPELHLTLPAYAPWSGVARVLLALGMWARTKQKGADPAAVLDQGLVFLVLMGFLIALPYHALPRPELSFPRGFSAVAVWLIAYPLVIPSTRGKAVLAILATAAMDPIGLLVNVAIGSSARPTPAELLPMFLPTVLTSVIAIVSSRIVYQLNLQAARGLEAGSYRLLAPLGRGGMGVVWRAEHRMLARPAAVKLVQPDKADGISGFELRARFEREAKATAALRSPHTVQLYDFGVTDEGAFYYAMELLEGLPLDALVEKFGPQPAGRVVHVLRQACRSLEEAHRVGLVHRDVKPSNLFLCRLGLESDFVKVLDFGLVKATARDGSASTPSLTMTGMVAGTPAFLPPEMALGGHEVDGRADVYSLGCVGWFLLAGRHVFERPTALATIHAHAKELPPPLPESVRSGVPPALEALLLACLAKDPSGRPPTALDLEERLAEIAADAPWTRGDAEAWWARHAAPTDAMTLPGGGVPTGPQ